MGGSSGSKIASEIPAGKRPIGGKDRRGRDLAGKRPVTEKRHTNTHKFSTFQSLRFK